MKLKVNISKIAILLMCIGLGLNLSCKSADTMTSVESSAALSELESQLNDQTFRIAITTVFPFNTAATTQVLNSVLINRTGNSANRIDVTGDGHFIEVSQSMTKGSLPFFGEQRLVAGSYNSDNQGIEFEGEPKDFEMDKHQKKDALEVTYHIKDKYESTEGYDVQLFIYADKSVDVHITSTLKNLIRYRGALKLVESVVP